MPSASPRQPARWCPRACSSVSVTFVVRLDGAGHCIAGDLIIEVLPEMDSPAASSKPPVCLLTGGLDSATCLAVARRDGYRCYALSFDYGQRHRAELKAAAGVGSSL